MNTSLSPRLQKSIGFHPKFALPPFAILLEWSTCICICCSPVSPPRGARDETVLSWDVPRRGSGKTTHSERYHWESACHNTERPFTPRWASTTVSCGGTHGAMGSIPIRSTPSSHCMRVRVDTGIKLQMSSSLFQLHPFVSSWLHPGGDRYGARDWLPVWGVATGKRSGH